MMLDVRRYMLVMWHRRSQSWIVGMGGVVVPSSSPLVIVAVFVGGQSEYVSDFCDSAPRQQATSHPLGIEPPFVLLAHGVPLGRSTLQICLYLCGVAQVLGDDCVDISQPQGYW
jgi:hypothetical protein